MIEEYARVICNTLNGSFKEEKPILVLEPGRFLVNDAVSLLTSVVAVKDLFGVNSIVVDAGINLLQSSKFQSHKIAIEKIGKNILTDIYGPTCMPADLLETGLELPTLSVGDILEFKCCGAYEESLSTQFSFYRPATIFVDGENIIEIRRREKLNDVLRKDG